MKYLIIVLMMFALINCAGKDGDDGVAGPPGVNGDNGVDGVDGVDGANGVDGVDGVDGIDGTINKVIKTISCDTQIVSFGNFQLYVSYISSRLSSGDLFISHTTQQLFSGSFLVSANAEASVNGRIFLFKGIVDGLDIYDIVQYDSINNRLVYDRGYHYSSSSPPEVRYYRGYSNDDSCNTFFYN